MNLRSVVDAAVTEQLRCHPGLSMNGHVAMLARAGHDGFMVRETVGRLFAEQSPMLETVLKFVRDNPGRAPREIRAGMVVLGRNPNSVPGSLTILHRRKLLRAAGPRGARRYYPVESNGIPNTEKVFAILADGKPRQFRSVFTELGGEGISHQQARNALVQLYKSGRIGVRGTRHAYEYHLPDARSGGPGVVSTTTVAAIRAAHMWPVTPGTGGPQLRIAA